MSPRILYGGTFDPVHLGHLAIARVVADLYDAPVHLLPSADPPHRASPGASAAQRATMLDLAIACDSRLRVDRRELHREGPSYTVDTMREVRGELGPEVPLIWVLGIDSARQLDTWHQWRRLFEFGHVLGVERPLGPVDPDWLRANAPAVAPELLSRACEPAQLATSAAGGYAALPIRPLRPESATQVRDRIAGHGDWQSLVPGAVASFILDQGLYRTPSAA
jgi:nicotinate-nucleotide adenylyltransferase